MAGILEARRSGKGQVVDAAIVDGAAHLATTFFGMLAAGIWKDGRGTNITDSGSPFYDCYECSDGKYISVGPIEAKFYGELLRLMDIDPASLGEQMDRGAWHGAKQCIAERFRSRTRDEWIALLEASDACAAGVLSFAEAPAHPHLQARGTFIEVEGVVQPAPAPRFSRSVPGTPFAPQPITPTNTDAALADWFTPGRVAELRANGIID
ncbi:CoA-transferase family III [compost metagenome]